MNPGTPALSIAALLISLVGAAVWLCVLYFVIRSAVTAGIRQARQGLVR